MRVPRATLAIEEPNMIVLLFTAALAADRDGDGYDSTAGDCNDFNAAINPGATEACNGRDDDCDAVVDDGFVTRLYFLDADRDGYGGTRALRACAAPVGYVSNRRDCNDASASINPGASEVCDDVDQDCDSSVDEGLATSTWYPDVDGDGWGDEDGAVSDCAAPTGYVDVGGDCDDAVATTNPDATETADGTDEDCDGRIDNVGAWTVETVDLGGSDDAELPMIFVEDHDGVYLSWAGDDDELAIVEEGTSGWTATTVRAGTGAIEDYDLCRGSDETWWVVYSDDASEDIILAALSGTTVTSETLDTDYYRTWTFGAGDVAISCADDQPVVAYSDGNDETLYFGSDETGVWSFSSIIDEDPRGLTMRPDSTGGFGLAYEQRDDNDAMYTYVDASGGASTTVLESVGRVGYNPSLAFTPDDRPVVLYWDNSDRTFQAATWDGAAWATAPVLALDAGYYDTDTALAIAPDGTMSAALVYGTEWYYMVVDYAVSVDGGATWVPERLEEASDAFPVEVALALDSWGDPHLLLANYGSAQLTYASRY